MKANQLVHREGASFSGLPFWIGLMALISASYGIIVTDGLLLLTVLWIPLLVVGIIGLLSIRSLAIDFEKAIATRYFDLLVFKVPFQVLDLSSFDLVELRLYRDIEKMQFKSIETTVRTKVYELHLRETGGSGIIITESSNYTHARELLKAISDGLGIPGRNSYEEWRTERLRVRRR